MQRYAGAWPQGAKHILGANKCGEFRACGDCGQDDCNVSDKCKWGDRGDWWRPKECMPKGKGLPNKVFTQFINQLLWWFLYDLNNNTNRC